MASFKSRMFEWFTIHAPKMTLGLLVFAFLGVIGKYVEGELEWRDNEIAKLRNEKVVLQQNIINLTEANNTNLQALEDFKAYNEAVIAASAELAERNQQNTVFITELREKIRYISEAKNGPIAKVLATTINQIQQNRASGKALEASILRQQITDAPASDDKPTAPVLSETIEAVQLNRKIQ